MTTSRRRIAILAVPALAALALALPAAAAAEWVLPGRGYGHGVGMSQYGAFGFAKNGRSHGRIIRHYYRNTNIRETRTRAVRVLLATGLESVPFTGAKRACGKRLRQKRSYSFRERNGRVSLRNAGGRRITGCGREGGARGGESVRFEGVGAYRGKLIGRAAAGSLYAINRVGIEDYIKGVIPNEVPASWPGAALRAQAIAARTYALATRVNGDGYDLYDDTRSQVYNGRSSEQRSTNRAAEATAKKVVKHNGSLATTYFFSASGGQTENSEFGFAGGSPRPWLKSVNDPYDHVSPHHRWRVRFSNSAMSSKLSGLFSGRLKRIRVLRTGVSPRIVRAKVVGSRGSSRVSGDTLRFRLGLRSTWVRFKKR